MYVYVYVYVHRHMQRGGYADKLIHIYMYCPALHIAGDLFLFPSQPIDHPLKVGMVIRKSRRANYKRSSSFPKCF